MDNPRQRRLQADFEKVKRLVAQSGGALVLVSTQGNPPVQYVIEYHCPSLVKGSLGEITLANQHQVNIILGSDYPLRMPAARMLTPVFNPHVFSTKDICLGGVWSPAETLDTLILRIGALLQLDPKVLNPNSPANTEANRWVKNNKSKIPVGTVTFRAAAPAAKRIQWEAE